LTSRRCFTAAFGITFDGRDEPAQPTFKLEPPRSSTKLRQEGVPHTGPLLLLLLLDEEEGAADGAAAAGVAAAGAGVLAATAAPLPLVGAATDALLSIVAAARCMFCTRCRALWGRCAGAFFLPAGPLPQKTKGQSNPVQLIQK
jgi:hypothetical protein